MSKIILQTESAPKVYNGKWYEIPEIYDQFSFAEDREQKVYRYVKDLLANREQHNPVDIASGTGNVIDFLLTLSRKGQIYAIEKEDKMYDFLIKKFDWRIVVIKALTSELFNHPLRNEIRSSLIISRFGFPSNVWDKKVAWEELKAINSLLSDDGLFVTIGWDETYNDELNEMWYRYIPDGIQAATFKNWREQRTRMMSSPRNANLTWYKTDIETKLIFPTLQESAYIMGTLFGDQALKEIVRRDKREWQMNMSITCDDKKSIKKILKGYERT